jgi:hypothetical protein
MRTLAKRWAQKSTTGAEFPPVRRAISMLHRVVPRRISKARVTRLDFMARPVLWRSPAKQFAAGPFKTVARF